MISIKSLTHFTYRRVNDQHLKIKQMHPLVGSDREIVCWWFKTLVASMRGIGDEWSEAVLLNVVVFHNNNKSWYFLVDECHPPWICYFY